ncbi:uncharacterized protein LOC105202802 [Solenopsis invicta]|uniref:uncharacterized protein LOC105202802 n=1 Tax=Solenopsis invicta TaxID=13686 RepID=UPI00193DE3D8|nr:uncharacterized protein LOC105202802 [Solenopsis invicta]
MPTDQINTNELQIPEGIVLADPGFYETNKIDLLLGAEIFFDLMCIGRVKKSNGQPTWQKTLLGWIVAGKLIAHNQEQKSTICSLVMNEQLNFSLVKFWQLESSERQTTRSPEERICEGHFARTYKRDESGRFIVSLPTREEQLSKIGDSRDLAIQRLKKLEKRFERQPTLKKKYSKFLQEYLDLQHMREIRQDNVKWMVRPQYYLPHHCVIKESSITTKLRVVFDASAKGSNGISLNDALMSGPVVQQDLFSILLRFRSFKYVMTSDIAKMYRQIRLDENQVPLQRIVWRENPTEEIKTYELLTLTYGTAPASFLATKVIQQLADIEEEQFPKGAAIASWDFYMDDLLTGADTIKEAIIIRNQVTELLAKGGFILRKWTFNNKELLKGMPECAVEHVTLDLDKDSITKTLGINWNPQEDALQYFIKVPHLVTCTKRIILSSIAQIFDPLGLLAPVIITAKILIQELWRLQLDWDESLPADIFSKWANCVENMQHLQAFRVPRRVLGDGDKKEIQLHGFSDVSEKAYGACIYLRSSDQNEILQSCLLCAKSRVAPLRAISIPRLELCGAQLLVQLMSKVKAALSLNVAKVYYWTDSSIVLHWIKATNKKLPVFVAHRIGEIQELSSVEDWNHVGTKENPADLVSRGSDARELCDSLLWWNGPSWLKNHIQVDQLSDSNNFEEDQSDSLNEQVVLTTIPQSSESFINRFSTFQRLVRVAATCIRFARRCRRNRQESSQDLTLEELEYSKRRLIGMEQLSGFQSEIQALRSNKPIPKSSSLKYLNPFLDDEGLLRVGGRLRHADLGYEVKHQWVLPHHSRLTDLIIIHEHLRNFHAGAEATLASVRQFYWPIRARGTVKGLLHKCVKCFRSRPRISQQIMGDLPVERMTPARPFVNTGVDFCGPIYVRPSKGRGIKRLKAYIAIFVCMTVKAVHLEIVSDLNTEAFLNAFKRFISRRERPANVYSDNGTNFVGANRDLNRCRELLSCEKGRNIIDFSNCEGIKWHFTPARAPHFGGLWESAVKSFKAYFYKTAADAAMTFEEAFTLISQIEAILNSRPIIAISTDPNDLNYLSPGHFLIGTTLTSYPELNLTDATIGRLSRWQMIEQMRQHFLEEVVYRIFIQFATSQ